MHNLCLLHSKTIANVRQRHPVFILRFIFGNAQQVVVVRTALDDAEGDAFLQLDMPCYEGFEGEDQEFAALFLGPSVV